MFSTRRRRVTIPGLCLGMVVALLAMLNWSSTTMSAPPEQDRVVKDAGAWRLIGPADGAVDTKGRPLTGAAIVYDRGSAERIEQYVSASRAVGSKAFSERATLPVLLTFNKPIGFEEFTALMKGSNAQVTSFRIRTINPDGSGGTLGGRPEPDGTIVSPEHVRALLDRQQARVGQAPTIAGIFDAEIIIDIAAYESLANHPQVYLVDTLRGVALVELRLANLSRIPIETVVLEGPYPALERLGLIGR